MTGHPRIPPVPPEEEATAELFRTALTHDGRVLNAASTLAHHPRLFKRFTVFAGLFLSHSVLPERDRELITLRCAHQFDSEYYFGHHVLLAADVLSPEEIARTVGPNAELVGLRPAPVGRCRRTGRYGQPQRHHLVGPRGQL
jgi:alkylhydroperoxidase family enzyme